MTSMTSLDGRRAGQRGFRAAIRRSPAHDASPFTAAALNMFLADTVVLLAKTMACHWNVQGPGFQALHQLTHAQCAELFGATDLLAKRVRALGVAAPDGLGQMLELTTLAPRLGATASLVAIIALAADHAAMAIHARDAAQEMDQAGDAASHAILVGRIAAHDQAAWLLRSHLPSDPTPSAGAP